MLGRAVKQHHPTPGHQQTQKSRPEQPTLKSAQSSLVNSRSSWLGTNPLKRSASEISGANAWGNKERAGKTYPSSQQMAASYDPSRLGKLHENIYFDENDFDDDNDIDFDDEPTLTNNTPLANSSTAPTLPNPLSSAGTLAKNLTPGSSAPIPWSSSPASHSLPPPKPARLSAKRDSLPWIEERKKAEREQDWETIPASSNIGGRSQVKPSDTPMKRDVLPWDTTASAVKEKQKEQRQQRKKMKASHDLPPSGQAPKVQKDNIASVFLSEEQRQVVDLVSEKKASVFFTGSAGTGKSVLLRELIRALRDNFRREPDRIAVTASTGLAACNVGGVTLHSFAGIGLGKEAVPELVRKIKKSQKAKSRWLRTKILIIDEISMVDGDLFDKLESIARIIRNNGRPFGGIQLVITGDFFQLPPVPDYGREAKFAFDAASWTTSISHTIGLTQVFRQKDPVFANMLNEMRLGKLTAKSINDFKRLSRNLSLDDDHQATELFPTRIEVENANNNKMRQLSGTEREFKSIDGGAIQDPVQRDKLLQNCMAPASIKVKKGAMVMLIKNTDEQLVNGSVGRVVSFMNEKTFTYYQEHEDEFQSTDASNSDVDPEVAVRRKGLNQKLNQDGSLDGGRNWPLVRFTLPDGSKRELLCMNETWKIELPNGEVQAFRQQIPLILAWALSIHKAQGQTLDRVKVDLGKIFEKGQAYVALSRATCQEGLQILRFEPSKVMAHERVRRFYESLYTAEQARTVKLAPAKNFASGDMAKKAHSHVVGGKQAASKAVKKETVKEEDDDEVALANMYY